MDTGRGYNNTSFRLNEIEFPLILFSSYEVDIYAMMKPNFDILWQAFGYSKSPDFSFESVYKNAKF